MSQSLTERYDERIAGMLSCYDRLVITGTLPVVCYAAGMTGYRERVPLRYAQAQHERLFADRGDRVAIQHHRPPGQRHGDHAAGYRCQRLALLKVLQRHGTLGRARAQDRGGDIHRSARLLHRGAWAATLTQQRLGPVRSACDCRPVICASSELICKTSCRRRPRQ